MSDDSLSNMRPFINGSKTAVQEILSPPFMPAFRASLVGILQQHGCTMQMDTPYWKILFPPGTFKREIYPRCESERYELTLPDGYVLNETISRFSGQSCLSFNLDDLPEPVQKQHQKLIEKLVRF